MNGKASTLRRIRQRLGSRGVAMVEGALIFPIMAGFLVMLELAHHSFDAYITTGHVARERAWSAATTGGLATCTQARDDTGYSSKAGAYFTIPGGAGGGADGSGSGPSTPPTGGKVSVPGGLPGGQNGFFKRTETVTATVTVHRGQSPVYTKTTTSKDTVYCNQQWHGSILDIIKSAFHK